jgi:hypothetical protein
MRKMRAAPTRLRASLDPISAMSWGVEPVRRDQQGKSIVRMGGFYAVVREIASGKESGDQRRTGNRLNSLALCD